MDALSLHLWMARKISASELRHEHSWIHQDLGIDPRQQPLKSRVGIIEVQGFSIL